MRVVLVLAITIPALLAIGVACGGGAQEVAVTPIPARESGAEADEMDDTDEADAVDEVDEADGVDETDAAEESPGPGEGDEGDPIEVCVELDDDDVCMGDDLCHDTAAGDTVDEVGCSDAQVDADNDGICDPAAASDGPGDCNLIDDNCPLTPNPAQDDFDGDLEGDACDDDDDNDGFTDAREIDAGSNPFDDASFPPVHWGPGIWREDVNPGCP